MKTIQVKVKPNAKTCELVELDNGTWLAQIRAPPVDGKANEALIRLIAQHFHQPRSRISIKRGASGRIKWVQITD